MADVDASHLCDVITPAPPTVQRPWWRFW
jgi:hypothetical protein